MHTGHHPRVADDRGTSGRTRSWGARSGRAVRWLGSFGVLIASLVLLAALTSVIAGRGGLVGVGLNVLIAAAAGAGLYFAASRLRLSRRAVAASAIAACVLAGLLHAAPGWRDQLDNYHARRLAELAAPTPYRDPVGKDRTQCNDLVDDAEWLARLLAAGSCTGRLDTIEVFGASPCADGRTFYHSLNYAGLSDGPLVERYGTTTLSFDNPDYAICYYGAPPAPDPHTS